MFPELPKERERRTIRRPELTGWATMTREEQLAAKRLVNQAYYQENKYRLQERKRLYARSRKGELPTRPMPATCEVCGQPPSGKFTVLHSDHNHRTGAFRGWLCLPCNTALGNALESVQRLKALAEYIEKHK